jgi:CspA family cold shock protein
MGTGGRPELATGRVLQFDQSRGYGFVAADDGGEDVFLHASVFEGDPGGLAPGMKVEFQVMAGDRGRKAFAVRLADDEASLVSRPSPSPQALSAGDDEQMCDVLSQAEFSHEITEILLSTVPSLTANQILGVRQSVLEFARKRGWVDL